MSESCVPWLVVAFAIACAAWTAEVARRRAIEVVRPTTPPEHRETLRQEDAELLREEVEYARRRLAEQKKPSVPP